MCLKIFQILCFSIGFFSATFASFLITRKIAKDEQIDFSNSFLDYLKNQIQIYKNAFTTRERK